MDITNQGRRAPMPPPMQSYQQRTQQYAPPEPIGLPPYRPPGLHVSTSSHSLPTSIQSSPHGYMATEEGVQPNLPSSQFSHRMPTPHAQPMQYQQYQPTHNLGAVQENAALYQTQPQPTYLATTPAHYQAQQSPHSNPAYPQPTAYSPANSYNQPSVPNSYQSYQSNQPSPQHQTVMLPYHQQSYGQYAVYQGQPSRFAFVKPVDPSHVALVSRAFPANTDIYNESAIPYAVIMNPLSPSLSAHPSVAPNDPAAVALTTSSTTGTNTPAMINSSPVSNTIANPSVNATSPGGAFNFSNFTVPEAPINSQLPQSSSTFPIIRPGASGVIRCKECKAYINGYVQWLNDGKGWKCNLCQVENLTPPTYFSPLRHDGRRNDWEDRDELKNASYEIYAPRDYMVRPPIPPLVCFVIDVSRTAQQCGFLQDACTAIMESLDRIASHPKALVSIVTFSDVVHFYTISMKAKGAVMHVLSTLDDVFLPVPVGLLVRAADCKSQLQNLIQSLPAMHAPCDNNWQSITDQSCALTALECTAFVMGRYGGRVMAFLSSLCTAGKGAMVDRQRELLEAKDTDAGIKAMKPQSVEVYKKLSDALQKHQMTVDVFALPPSIGGNLNQHPLNSPMYGHTPTARHMDLITWTEVIRSTGGTLHYFPNYDACLIGEMNTQRQAFMETIKHVLFRNQCFESVFRVRVSKGISVNDFHGHFTIRGSSLVSIPTCDDGKSISFELVIDQSDKNALIAYKERHAIIQTGLLYTSFMGERRIIVHTIAVPLQANVARLVEALNVDVALGVMSKRAVWLAYAHSAKHAREYIKQKAASLRRAIVKSQANQSLVRPIIESLDYHLLCMYKSPAFKDIDGIGSPATMPLDSAAAMLAQLYPASPRQALYFYSPALVPLHQCIHDPSLGMLEISERGMSPILPASLPLSVMSLSSAPANTSSLDQWGHPMHPVTPQQTSSLWLLFTGFDLILRVGLALDINTLQNIFGTSIQTTSQLNALSFPLDLGNVDSLQTMDPSDSSLRTRISNIIAHYRSQADHCLAVRVIREHDASDVLFFMHFAEDRRGKEAGIEEWKQWLDAA